jgi:hypothetical protein
MASATRCAIEWRDINEIDRSVRLFRKDTTQTKTTFKKAQWVTLSVNSLSALVNDLRRLRR